MQTKPGSAKMKATGVVIMRLLLPLALFVVYLGVIGLGAGTPSSLSKTVDLALVALPLAFMVFLSILVVQERYTGGEPVILKRLRGWITDDPIA